ncbi:MAG: AzlD domain-containing protein [Gammaproteobacteria bacterium]
MTTYHWLLVIVGAGIGTYALRAAPFVSERLRKLGQDNFKFLSYVSFAIAAGIVARALVYRGGELAAPNEMAIKLGAVVIALVLLRLTRSIPLALFSGAAFGVWLKWLAAAY